MWIPVFWDMTSCRWVMIPNPSNKFIFIRSRTLQPWRWRRKVSSKRHETPTDAAFNPRTQESSITRLRELQSSRKNVFSVRWELNFQTLRLTSRLRVLLTFSHPKSPCSTRESMESRPSFVQVRFCRSNAHILTNSVVTGGGLNHCCLAAVVCLWLPCGRNTTVVTKPRPYPPPHAFYTYFRNIQNSTNKV